jgi:hypothetical protein
MIRFFDSATEASITRGGYAALYLDGEFAATKEEAKAFEHVRWITVLGDPEAGAGDYEPGNPLFDESGRLRKWAQERRAHGKRVRPYCDRADARKAAIELKGLRHEWWISTLDGKRWTAKELAADLAAHWGVRIAEKDLWANQYQGGMHASEDVSDLYGTW